MNCAGSSGSASGVNMTGTCSIIGCSVGTGVCVNAGVLVGVNVGVSVRVGVLVAV
jgi:hypothetical protein